MSLLRKQPPQAVKVKALQTVIYEPHKATICLEHHLPKELTCLQPHCHLRHLAFCKDCHPLVHPLISVNRLVPKMALFLRQQWDRIGKQHKTIESQWKHCLVNVNYCIDILKEIKLQIQDRSQKVTFIVFDQLLSEVYSMLKHEGTNISLEMMLKNFAKINDKFHFIQTDDKSVNCQPVQQERIHHKSQVHKAAHRTKSFSESALAFSQQLAAIIEEKLKFQKRVGRLKDLSQARIFTIKDLMKEQSKLQQVGQVLVEVGKKKEGQDIDIGQLLGKCQNLKSLRISSKSSGPVDQQKWKKVVNGMEYLKYLRELILNLRGCDLPFLTQLFKERNKAVRQVEKLVLTISDEKNLDIKQVVAFVNTMELRHLHLTLTRDGLGKEQMLYLLKNIRLSTSMSQLPLNEFMLNLSKNKVSQGQDISEVSNLFNLKTSKIKQHSLTL